MKKILIISPHFPPSNLTSVHRARILVNHLPAFDWEPVILTVHERFYEEEPDHHLEKILPEGLRIEKVNAIPLTKPRMIGDIGLRAFVSIFRKAKRLILTERIDFVYITIPSFYGALWGRWLHEKTGVKYGIDYIDPWVHVFPGSNKIFSRHWFSTKIAAFLEPVAVKKAAIITGVAEGYYNDVIVRNPHLKRSCLFAALPYGSEAGDHEAVRRLNIKPYLFDNNESKVRMLYAGAMLPRAYAPLEKIFSSIQSHPDIFNNVEFHFIGSGKTADDPNGFNIKPLAVQYGLWQKNVFEYPKRIPYLDVLQHLNAATGIFILGSTEAHYTPSKVYQAVLSGKPIFAVLHEGSTAVPVIRESNAGTVLDFNGEDDLDKLEYEFHVIFQGYKTGIPQFNKADTNHSAFEKYSARNVTQTLVEILNKL